MRVARLRALALAGVLLVCAPAVRADPPAVAQSGDVIVQLTNGEAYRGALVEQVPNDHLTMTLPTGETRRFAWGELRAIQWAQPAATAAPAPAPTRAEPAPPPAKPHTKGKGMRIAGWVTLGSGALLGATGALVFAIAQDQKNTYQRCAPACSPETIANDRNANVLGAYGIVMMALGGASAITGIVLLAAAPSSSSSPSVTAYAGPGSMGLAGSF